MARTRRTKPPPRAAKRAAVGTDDTLSGELFAADARAVWVEATAKGRATARKIVPLAVARRAEDFIAAGTNAQALAADHAELWSVPLVYASPGYGKDDVVGNVGLLTIHAHRGEVIEATPRDEAVAALSMLWRRR